MRCYTRCSVRFDFKSGCHAGGKTPKKRLILSVAVLIARAGWYTGIIPFRRYLNAYHGMLLDFFVILGTAYGFLNEFCVA